MQPMIFWYAVAALVVGLATALSLIGGAVGFMAEGWLVFSYRGRS